MPSRRLLFCLLAAGLLLAGCGRDSGGTFGAETDDPGYREGKQLDKQGRTQEALSTFLKVIERRGDQAAPESHLEVGIILQQHVKDPLEAIHHFRKYLEQRPNSQQAPLVRQQIDAAKREFVSTIQGPQPYDSQVARLDGYDRIDRLQRENDQLKAELATLRGGAEVVRPTNTGRISLAEPTSPAVSATPAEDTSPIVLAPMGPRETEATVVQSSPPPGAVTTTRPELSRPTSPAAAPGGKRHTVAPKDSLYAIAKRYYGVANNAKVQEILQANRDILPTAEALKPGMVLRIP